jgi:O-antigen/teichoic acid export membrane protein
MDCRALIGQDCSVNEADVTPGELPLSTLVRRGAAWGVIANVGSQLLRFGGSWLLTRLLFPEAFGLMAIVNTLIVGLHLFSDIGVGPSIVQNARGADPAFLNTAWTVQVLRGSLLWVIACALAFPAAAFYEQDALAPLMMVVGVTALLDGLNSTRRHSAYRSVDLARASMIELGSQVVGVVAMVAWALVDRSVWALVAGGVANSAAMLVLSYTALSGLRNRFHWDRTALHAMLRFGRWVFLSTVLTFLVMQSDKLVFGKLVPIAMLGVYGIGANIATMPSLFLGRLGSTFFFPVYSRVHNAGDDLREAFLRIRRPWLVVTGWVLAGLAGGGQAAIDLLYLPAYSEAGWMTQLLALGTWFSVLEITNGSVLLARGSPKWIAAASTGKLAGMLLLIPLGFSLDGFRGAVLGLVCSDLLRYAISAYAVGRAGLRGWPQDLRLTAWVGLTALAGWQVALYGQGAGWSSVAVAAAVFVAVTAAWAPLLRIVGSGLRRVAL